MKPIRLKISGLNSFRETQDIDFSKLTETGVFGIFGPTGSGKSSILDAITLALYGTVERAANNTQGILNHGEENLNVQYTFSLGSEERQRIYRAERSYKRTGERTVKSATCRLIEITEGCENVLASKSDEITQKIQEVIGLTVDDFTRAVVLPQGKFAEFLTLKPKDRRQMLERLFGLEAYGRDLTSRLSEEVQTAHLELNGVEQRQQGLGDASKERISEAEQELNSSIAAVNTVTEELNRLRKSFEADKEVWTLQEQLSKIQQRENELSIRQPQVELLKENLAAAGRAELVRPLLSELNDTEKRFKEIETKDQEAGVKLVIFQRACQEAENKWSLAYQKKAEAEPRLLRRIEQLEQAKSLAGEVDERTAKLKGLRSQYEGFAQKRKEYAQKIEALSRQKTDNEKLLQELKERLTAITVDPAERTKINVSAKALEAYEMIEQQYNEAKIALVQNEQKLKNLREELTQTEQAVKASQAGLAELKTRIAEHQTEESGNSINNHLSIKDLSNGDSSDNHFSNDGLNNNGLSNNGLSKEESLGQQAQELERLRALLTNIERTENEWLKEKAEHQKNETLLYSVREEAKQLESKQQEIFNSLEEISSIYRQKANALKEMERKNLASHLAEELVEGVLCPVCGSVHHPLPAQSADQEAETKAKQDLEHIELEQKRLEEEKTVLTTRVAVAQTNLTSKSETVQNQAKAIEEKHKDLRNYRECLKEEERELSLQELQTGFAKKEADLVRARQEFNLWKKQGEELTRRLEEIQLRVIETTERNTKVQSQAASASAVVEENVNRLSQLQSEKQKRQEVLEQVCEGIPFSDILPLQEKYSQWDQESAQITQKAAALEVKIKELEQAHQQVNQENNANELNLKELETVGREAAQTVEDLKQKLTQITGGSEVTACMESAQQELNNVVKIEAENKGIYDQAQKELQQAEQAKAILKRELELSMETKTGLQAKLEKALKEAQFITVAAAEQALRSPAEREQLEREISEFQQETALLKERKAETLKTLEGRSISPQEWLAWPIRLKHAEEGQTNALEHRGAAQRSLERLKEIHAEWTRLEIKRNSLAKRQNQLKTLQNIFKGNAFVEFIAEEQLITVAIDASERLGQLTNHRYALEVDSDGGFIMRDDANGGCHRPVSTLSGGETFLTSLALALALSTQIQLRGEAPLEFFFLDEGFGTLDPSLLEVVMNTLEKLRLQNLTIGIISHVPELRNRLARKLIVTPSQPGGDGSKVKLEMA